MSETVVNLDSYVDGYKVISTNYTTVTLENGMTVEKSKCKYIGIDQYKGSTYYRYIDEEGATMHEHEKAPQHDPKETVKEHATDQFTSDKIERELPDTEESETVEEE